MELETTYGTSLYHKEQHMEHLLIHNMFHEQILYHHKPHIHYHLLQCHQSFRNNQAISQASCHHEVK